MARLALSAIGRDRPGIVAATTAALLRHGANVEDSRMTILRGHFTMTLVLSVPDALDQGLLTRELEAVAADLGLDALTVSPVAPLAEAAPRATHVVVVYGVDHPGIVQHAAQVLADRDITITDLETRLVGEQEGQPPFYALMMEIALPEEEEPADLDKALSEVGSSESVEVSLRELERDDL